MNLHDKHEHTETSSREHNAGSVHDAHQEPDGRVPERGDSSHAMPRTQAFEAIPGKGVYFVR
jgi:hypothetical protein